jgi:hypothetical protein
MNIVIGRLGEHQRKSVRVWNWIDKDARTGATSHIVEDYVIEPCLVGKSPRARGPAANGALTPGFSIHKYPPIQILSGSRHTGFGIAMTANSRSSNGWRTG